MPPPQQISPEEMLELRRNSIATGAEPGCVEQLLRFFADPVEPQTKTGRWRPHPLLLLWGVIGLFGVGVFLFFSWPHG